MADLRQFGLIGEKLGHSFSKKYFTEKFHKQQIPAAYELYELANIQELSEVLKTPNLVGLNVTIPYKSAVIPFMDELSPEAEAIQAVNTIKLHRDGRISGNNSDITGFSVSVKNLLGGTKISRAIVLGTGGSSKAVEYVLQHHLQLEKWYMVSRTPHAGNHISYIDLLDFDIDNYPLIINTTPLGMFPKVEASPYFPYEKLSGKHFALDLIYNPEETSFMKNCAQYGAKVQNGMQMLIEQAEKSWAIWNA